MWRGGDAHGHGDLWSQNALCATPTHTPTPTRVRYSSPCPRRVEFFPSFFFSLICCSTIKVLQKVTECFTKIDVTIQYVVSCWYKSLTSSMCSCSQVSLHSYSYVIDIIIFFLSPSPILTLFQPITGLLSSLLLWCGGAVDRRSIAKSKTANTTLW